MVSNAFPRFGIGGTGLCANFSDKRGAGPAQSTARDNALQQCQGIRREGHTLSEPTNVLVRGQSDRKEFPGRRFQSDQKHDHGDHRRGQAHADAWPDRQSLARDAGPRDPGRGVR